MRLTFEEWKKQVDRILVIKTSMTSEDLPDCDYRDMWESGYSPTRAAARAIREASTY